MYYGLPLRVFILVCVVDHDIGESVFAVGYDANMTFHGVGLAGLWGKKQKAWCSGHSFRGELRHPRAGEGKERGCTERSVPVTDWSS